MQARTAPQMCVSGIVHDPWMPESPSRIHRRTSRHVSNSDSVGVCSCGSAGIMQPCSSAIWSSRGIAEPRAPAEPPDCSALNVLGSFIAFLSARRRLSRRSLSLVVRAQSGALGRSSAHHCPRLRFGELAARLLPAFASDCGEVCFDRIHSSLHRLCSPAFRLRSSSG